jgi:NHL repeat
MSSFTNRLLAGMCALALSLAFAGSSALALQTHKQLEGKEPNTAAILHGACCMSGLAVNSSDGDLYALDQYDPTSFSWGLVHRFHSDGSYDQAFDEATLALSETTSEPQAVAVDDSATASKGRIYIADSGHNQVDAIDSTGALVSAFGSEGRINGSEDVPGDPDAIPTGGFSRPCGVAVDHASGDLLVADQNSNRIWIFDSSGAYRGRIADSGLNGPCALAFDSNGNLYVRNANDGRVLRFTRSSATEYEFGSIFYSAEEGGATGVAVNASDNHVFVDRGDRVAEYEGGTLVSTFGEGVLDGGATGIAADPTSGHVYVADNSSIHAFGSLVTLPDATTGAATAVAGTTATVSGAVDPAGGPQAECVFEYGTKESYGQSVPCEPAGPYVSAQAVQAKLTGLTPTTTYHYRLHATSAEGANNGGDRTFTTAGAPSIASPEGGGAGIWSAEVGSTTATMTALIDPNGSATTYHFEYGPTASYGTSVPPVPGSEIGSGTEPVEVSQSLTNLEADTTYHYRIVATNDNGTVDGPDKTFTTFPPLPAEEPDSCPNAAYRGVVGSKLPDCRAYEMVSPVEKNGADVNGQNYPVFVASRSGERIEFPTRTGMGDTHGSGAGGYSEFIATRGSTSWSSKGIIPPPALNTPLELGIGGVPGGSTRAFSEELDRAVFEGYDLPGVPGAYPNAVNLYMEDTASVALLEPISRFEGFEEEVFPFFWVPTLGASSSDLGVVSFQMNANLVPGATGPRPKVYALEHGTVRLVGILPDKSVPSGGSALVRKFIPGLEYKDTVSRDGARILFMSPASGSNRQLYLRKNGTSTALVSQSEASVPTTAEGVLFQAATPDGTKVVFSTTSRLLDADPGGSGAGLYLYTDSLDPEHESNLTFIARISSTFNLEHEVVKGISDDGSHIYFTSLSTPTLPPQVASGGLLLWDSGQIRRVAPETPGGRIEFQEEARVSADGRQIAFLNREPLTSDEFSRSSADLRGNPVTNQELYVYDENADTLKCVSCPTTGAKARYGVELAPEATTPTNPGFQIYTLPHFLSRDGRYVFFNTKEALVPQDTDKVTDVYEYDTQTGTVSLLSTGSGETGTWWVDASPEGHDVFMITRQQLSRWDTDKLVDLYDAHIGGGLPDPPAVHTPCSGDACQGTPSAVPSFNTASEFNGLGNPVFKVTGKPTSKALTRAQRLRRALAKCHRKRRKRRIACEAAARRRYVAPKRARYATRRAGR